MPRDSKFLALTILAAATAAAQPSTRTVSMPTSSYSLTALAPVLIVDSVGPSVDFWVKRLGFIKENEVPGPDGTLAFASVKKDGVEIMYQSRASVVADNPAAATELHGHSTALFLTMPSMRDLGVVEREVAGAPIVKPRHDTFYGTTEFYIREPGGNVVGFSAKKE